MHPLNPYALKPPDFDCLCRTNKDLADAVGYQNGKKVSIDFQDAVSVRKLTEAILRNDFGVDVELRDDRLCPPIPNRLNYLAWIEEILDGTCADLLRTLKVVGQRANDSEVSRSKRQRGEAPRFAHRILDIGTGSCCIYALLGSSLHEDWCFVGTDIDPVSLSHARSIIERQESQTLRCQNSTFRKHHMRLSDQVSLLLRRPEDKLLPNLDDLSNQPAAVPEQLFPGTLFSAIMCNPPFYKDEDDMLRSLEKKRTTPNSICHGSPSEMIYDGGEVAFVQRMIAESMNKPHLSMWYTAMIGKLDDVEPIIDALKARGIENFLVAEFHQGVTKRWAIAWSHLPFRLPPPLTAMTVSLLKKSLPASTGHHSFTFDADQRDARICAEHLRSHLQIIEGTSLQSISETAAYIIASHDTWSRKARRRAAQGHGLERSSDAEPGLIVTFHVTELQNQLTLSVTWTFGRHRQLFESFVMSVISVWVKNRGEKM